MTKRSGRWILVALVLVVSGYVVAKLLSKRYRQIEAVTSLPADLEVVEGTAVVFRRSTVGRVARLGEARWGIETAFRVHDGLEIWFPVTVLDRAAVRAGTGDSVRIQLQQTSAGIALLVQQGTIALRLERRQGVWIDDDSQSRSAVTVNGKAVKAGSSLRLLPGDYLGLSGVDVRIGRFLKRTAADLVFATARLCPLEGVAKWLPWHPNAEEQRACANRTVRGGAQLGMTETFGLTKPVLKLIPSEGNAAIVAGDSLSIALVAKQDLKAEVEQMVAYLNAPATSRPEPITHFEHTVANADEMVRSITRVANELKTTTGAINTALRSPDGLGPVILGAGSHESLRQTLANLAGVTGRLADPNGTLVQNLGLDPVVSKTTRSLAVADSTMDLVRAQVLRLSPRVELAVDKVTSAMDGVEGTLQSLKTAAEDVSALKNSLSSGKAKTFGLGTVGLIAASALTSILANLGTIF